MVSRRAPTKVEQIEQRKESKKQNEKIKPDKKLLENNPETRSEKTDEDLKTLYNVEINNNFDLLVYDNEACGQ